MSLVLGLAAGMLVGALLARRYFCKGRAYQQCPVQSEHGIRWFDPCPSESRWHHFTYHYELALPKGPRHG